MIEPSQMNKPGKKGIDRLTAAMGYSLKGLKAAYQNEAAIRQELLLGLFIIPLAFYIAGNGIELALLLGSFFLVLLMELVNSAIEAIVDRISFDFHPLSGQAKDIGSSLVLVAFIIFAITWISILLYYQ